MNKKYFMVIDGAVNSTHDVYAIDDSLFELLFPGETDVAFLEDVETRLRSSGIDEESFFNKIYSNPVDKNTIIGLHGILHSTGSYCRKEHFTSGREIDGKTSNG